MQVVRGVRSDARAWQGNGEMYGRTVLYIQHVFITVRLLIKNMVSRAVQYRTYGVLLVRINRVHVLPVTGMYY